MLKELVTPHAANVFVGKLGDILEKAVDKPLGYALSWGRLWSLWPVHIETACCSVEFGAASGPKYDVERFGIIEAFGNVTLRQCDLPPRIKCGMNQRYNPPAYKKAWPIAIT